MDLTNDCTVSDRTWPLPKQPWVMRMTWSDLLLAKHVDVQAWMVSRCDSRDSWIKRVKMIDTLAWADLMLVMEQKHRSRVLADFPGRTKFLPIHVLDIPDEYGYMDTALIQLIRSAADPIIESNLSSHQSES